MNELAHVPNFESFWSFSRSKPGYSGVATFCKRDYTLDAIEGMNCPDFDQEGRIIMTDHGTFVLFNIYFPNGAAEGRLEYKMGFYRQFQKHCREWRNKGRHVIVLGDFNTAHKEIDQYSTTVKSGALAEEKLWMDSFVEDGFIDTFRQMHPDESKYSWWDPRTNKRKGNKGWRIDYVFCDADFFSSHVIEAGIMDHQMGSDHCPVYIKIKPLAPLPPHEPAALSSLKMKKLKKQTGLMSFFNKPSASSSIPSTPTPDPEEIFKESPSTESKSSSSKSKPTTSKPLKTTKATAKTITSKYFPAKPKPTLGASTESHAIDVDLTANGKEAEPIIVLDESSNDNSQKNSPTTSKTENKGKRSINSFFQPEKKKQK
eukprot:TRINITY_DN21895_c0_g1_i1.p1 TRINITY_DN21895_c0_g1~~TRINITY_DN21895_c0_g1_i1.p1  ORF type:complete len:429 (-),score=87.39 TRINITY_DN21895_c0_g1_i1:8-1123(-)